MALTRSTTPTAVSMLLEDNNSKQSSFSFFLPAAASIAEVDTFMTATRNLLLPLTNARLIGATASFAYTEDAPTTAPPESEVERKLSLTFDTANSRQKVRLELPSPVFTIESSGTNAIALTNPLLVAFAGQIVDGPIGPNNGAVSISGGDIIRLARAIVKHRYRPE